MDKNIPLHLQEIIFSSSDPSISRAISKLEHDGQIIKIAPRIYSPNKDESPAIIIRRNIFKIIGHLFPGALLSHRSALEYKPTATGDLFLTYKHNRNVSLPGVTLNLLEGPGPVAGDNLFTDGLYVSQEERALLENFQPARKLGPLSKTLTPPQIEERLDQVIRVKGEEGLNTMRDRARQLSVDLGMEKEFKGLNRMISAILTTKPSEILTSPIAKARAFGHPYDPARVTLFNELFEALQQKQFAPLPEKNTTIKSFRNFAFLEAYFSNFIEGTKFSVEEAWQIIDSGKPMPARDEDSHDVLGTYQIVSNRKEMSVTPESAEHLMNILQYRHKIMLSARPSKNPGEFKDKNNRAGDTEFVGYSLVKGTLMEGFGFYRALKDPFAKAAYMMFMVSEVHPFLDGNGRIARVMMNAELVKAEQIRVIIPTVYREDYLGALRQLTRRHEPGKYIRMLERAHAFSATVVGEDMDALIHILTRSNAFNEGDENVLQIISPEKKPWEGGDDEQVPPIRGIRR